ncbi:MAG: hypothetical protein DMF81_09830 [Acidobacteria bacterium]|nr:MAG: hypothetical protein DMF81_09830 [Acidobacteriota bacterium]
MTSMRASIRFALLLAVLALTAASAPAADAIFNPGVLHQVRIVMDPADWRALIDNFRSNDYYAANISLDGTVVQQVGVRSRGKGSRSDTKPGVKVDFNKYVAAQTFHGLKSVQVKNLIQDATMVRERLSMAVFEAMGVAAPADSYAQVFVNDEYWGVFNLVESVEEPFLQARFGQSNGQLFKYEYQDAWDFSSKGTDPNAYVPIPLKPETNKDNPTTAALVDFVQKANNAADSSFVGDISAYVDPRQILTYVAVENAIVENDGFVGYAGMNNFFVYQLAGGTKFTFIPWDQNTTFVSADWPLFQRTDTNVLIRRLLADPTLKQFYVDAIKKAVASFVNTSWLGPQLDADYNLIRNAALTDPKKPFSNDEFESSINGLRGVIAGRAPDVQAQAP